MSTQSPHLVLNAFLMGGGQHEAAWRLPEARPSDTIDVRHFQHLAQVAERGRLDSIFFADIPAITGDPGRRPFETFEPVVILSAIAAVTERIGLIGTASTTFETPFELARTFATLDLVSGGRAGWNSVTTAAHAAARNFGHDALPSHAERYAIADEFIEVVLGLWSSWDDDAVIDDRERGVYADPERVRPLDHAGRYFRVAGPLPVGRSPQGHPVVVQAGSSPAGIALAARHAEAVFTAQRTLAEAQAFYTELKAATRAAGRNPDHVKILPGLVPFIGSTEAEARALEDRYDDLVVHDLALQQLAATAGLSPQDLDLDGPLPEAALRVDGVEENKSRWELTLGLARRDGLTVRQVLKSLSGGRGHRTIAGTPQQVADSLEAWFRAGGADGFNIMAPTFPDGLETFVDQVVPILQSRGLVRTEYTGHTLREHYGLPVPADHAHLPALADAAV